MNYRNIAVSELQEFLNDFPKLTLGQAILAIVNKKEVDDMQLSVKGWLFEVSDEDFYTAIEKAKLDERD